MNYTVQSCKYTFKNFIYLLPFAIIPAWFLSLSTDQDAILCLMDTIFNGKINDLHFSHIFRAISILTFASWYSVVFGLASIVMMIVCGAMIMAMLDKHMRIGKRTFTGIFSKLNDNLVSTAGFVLLLLAIYELWTLLASVVVYFCSLIPVVWLAYIFAAIFYLAMHIVLIYAVGQIYLWLPCMQITGFRALEAFNYSYHLMAPVRWGILLVQTILLFVVESAICACALLIAEPITFKIITTAIYAILIMVYCVRMEIVYFDRENIERADKKRYY